MIFKCKNCEGNTVYSPLKKDLYCPYCESLGSGEKGSARQGLAECSNCGGELHIDPHTSASRCPYCSCYLIFDERVEGEYTPHLILPFILDKEKVKEEIRKKFKARVFAPWDFLSEARLDSMTGMYVPFWMYDYGTKSHFEGEGTTIRIWVKGKKEYTETSIFHVVREMETEFSRIPVDASEAMPDSTMDLMEPYDYAALEQFKEKYMSGFFAEKYNQGADALESRSKSRVIQDAQALLKRTLSGYTSLRTTKDTVDVFKKDVNYALLPVWIYTYKYKEKEYRFHVNGQTGKMIGVIPQSIGKAIGYGMTVFGILSAIMLLIRQVLTVL